MGTMFSFGIHIDCIKCKILFLILLNLISRRYGLVTPNFKLIKKVDGDRSVCFFISVRSSPNVVALRITKSSRKKLICLTYFRAMDLFPTTLIFAILADVICPLR
jgi:hypothetical protein